jgi:hypothetical protein
MFGWGKNIKVVVGSVGRGGGWGRIGLAQDRCPALVNAAINLRVPSKAGNFLPHWVPVNFLGRVLLSGAS